jgi:hypothetical protein
VGIEIEAATRARFDDVATVLGPRNPASTVCWCLSHRLDSRTNRELVGPARRAYVRELTGRPVAPGVLAYDGGEVVGWAAVAPRSQLPFERSRKIPHVDDLPVWVVWCIRVIAAGESRMRSSAGRWTTPQPTVPPPSRGTRPTTRASGSTRPWPSSARATCSEEAGFTKAADTDAVAGGFPRVLMRRALP